MSSPCRLKIDFEQWSELADRDPARFELLRHKLIEELIAAASARSQQRLRGLQWRIDQVRDHSPNPLAACIALSNMMWQAFAGEGGLAETLNRQSADHEGKGATAQILPFSRQHQ